MSYNESLSPNSNYPPMSQSEWDNAPWNEVSLPEKDFEVTVSQTLSKSTSVTIDNYALYKDEEDGHCYYETDDVNWKEEYHENDHYTPLQLIELFKTHLENELQLADNQKEKNYCKYLIKECSDWIEDEMEVIKD